MRHITTLLLLALTITAPQAQAHPGGHTGGHHSEEVPWQEATVWPDRIVATIDEDPSHAISVSWRTEGTVTATRAEIAPAAPDARFDLGARAVPAATQILDLASITHAGLSAPVADNRGLPQTAHHEVRFEGLAPDTLYAYRVQGGEGKWSEWLQTRTAPVSGPVRFIYLGDAQNDLDSHWPRVIRAAFQSAPDARFILHAGDLVNRGSRDLEWAHWFRAGGFIHGMIPAVPVAGNHEYDTYDLGPAQKAKLLSLLWRPQFRLPEARGLPETLQETVYAVRYSPDLHVFVLNSNMSDMADQAAWLDAQLAASDARWRVVAMHHPVFSSGRDRDSPDKREVLLPVLLKHRVDLVLQGHDHTYARGSIAAPSQAPARQTPARQTPAREAATGAGEVLAMFVNSVSGPKQYQFSKTGWEQYAPTGVKLDRRAENTQFYQVIEIDGTALRYAAYTADGALYDAFALEKSPSGAKTLSAPDSLPPERRFDNTMPYPKD